jgi:uncharacterized protein YbbC (DUF1343 family)/CubicO group peptidase (beta-lactamase class C family)
MLACAPEKATSAHRVVLPTARAAHAPTQVEPGAGQTPRASQLEQAKPTSGELNSPRTAAQLESGEPSFDSSGIRFVIEAALRRGELPGCVIAVGDAQGLRYLEAFGERTSGEAMTVDTRFDLASLTKPVATALSIMLLAERGQVNLRAPAATYLAELRAPDKRNISLEQLLLHTSGLPKVNPLSASEGGRARARAAIAHETLLTEPGSHFEYSDLGYILLGEVVESVTGQSLDAFAREQLFAPLGMHTTHFLPDPAQSQLYAPTELRDDVLIRAVVDDPRAYRLQGVAGHAGLFSTATDLSRFARMLLRKGELDGVRVLSERSVERMLLPRQLDSAMRALGFDVQSSYALGKPLGMSMRAVGHGGYTGTSIWIDPAQDVFVILLSNRVHKGPRGTIHPLTSAVGDLALRAAILGSRARGHASTKPEPNPLQLGIDVLEAEHFARLRGRSVAVLSHLPARDSSSKSSLYAIAGAPQLKMTALFSPEHGLLGQAEGVVQSGSLNAVPVHSLFGATRRPTPQMLNGVQVVVIDLVDVGTRFYTYMATALAMCEVAGELGIDVVLLDRPNPLDGTHVEGPVSEPAFASFVNYYPLPLRHGMTAGELLRLLIRARALKTRLHVVKVEGWKAAQWFAQTGLTWHAPSPNLRSPEQALLYPAVGLVEGTNVSVGRGTDRAFELLGAPFIDGPALVRALEAEALAGVRVSATKFRPRVGPYKNSEIAGISLTITNPETYSAAATGLALARSLHTLYPGAWDASRLPLLVAHRAIVERLMAGADLSELSRMAGEDLNDFLSQRAAALLYRR